MFFRTLRIRHRLAISLMGIDTKIHKTLNLAAIGEIMDIEDSAALKRFDKTCEERQRPSVSGR